jgi:hypothetical protein
MLAPSALGEVLGYSARPHPFTVNVLRRDLQRTRLSYPEDWSKYGLDEADAS